MEGMSEKLPPRPRQITMAVAMSVVGSLLLVVSLFDTLGRLRTPDTRESIEEFLVDLPGGGPPLETAQVVDALRMLTFLSGALAAMLLVFAVFVLQRHRGARIGFTVVAALLLVTIPVAGLMPVLLAVAAGLIWSRPGRDWYAGRAPATPSIPPPDRPADSPADHPADPQGPPALSEQGPPPSPYPFGSAPTPDQPHEQQPQGPAQQHPPQYAQPYAGYPPPYQQSGPAKDRDKRPLTVTLAAWLTWLGAGLVSAGMLVFAVVLASGGDLFVEEFDKAARGSDLTLSRDEVLAVGWAIALFFLVWSLIAIVLAAFAFRRSNPARIALSVSSTMAALVSLLMILSLISVVTLLMAGAVTVLLFTGGANEWYARRDDHSGGPGSGHQTPYNPYYPQGYPQGYAQQPPYQQPEKQKPW